MPGDPRNQQTQAGEERDPQQSAPVRNLPFALAEGPPGDGNVHDVGDEERGEERAHDLLLEDGVREEVLARGAEDEEVDEAEEADDVRELQDRDLGRAREGL